MTSPAKRFYDHAKTRLSWMIRDHAPQRRVVRDIQGVRMAMPWSHRLPDYTPSGSIYGQNLVELARLLARTQPLTVLDIGANIGDSTLQILDAVSDAAVLCVEADPFYLPYLRENTAAHPEATIVEAMLATSPDTGATTAVRRGGTTRFTNTGDGAAITTVTAQSLRDAHPGLTPLRLVKSDTDGYDVSLVPAVARVWNDTPPVLFFEYDPHLTRIAGLNPLDVWTELGDLGYHDAAVWANGGHPVMRTTVDDIVPHARELAAVVPPRRARPYWDVSVVHRDDAAGATALAELIPR